jgi:hypothetical protein
VDGTKRVFRVYEVCSDGAAAFRKQISRAMVVSFLSFQMEEAAEAARQCGRVNRGLRVTVKGGGVGTARSPTHFQARTQA